MRRIFKKYNRTTLVIATTAISIMASLVIMVIILTVLGQLIDSDQVIISTVTPLLVAAPITYYIYGVLKEVEHLQTALENSITKEKEAIYIATIHGAQHVTNNLLNQLNLVKLEINKDKSFDKNVAKLFESMLLEADFLIKKLSSVENINAEEIKNSVSPTQNKHYY